MLELVFMKVKEPDTDIMMTHVNLLMTIFHSLVIANDSYLKCS